MWFRRKKLAVAVELRLGGQSRELIIPCFSGNICFKKLVSTAPIFIFTIFHALSKLNFISL